ncbi:MAG TPA: matrixin family metalloprotease [Conexibacter sp.]
MGRRRGLHRDGLCREPRLAGTGDPTNLYYDLLSMAAHESGHELGLGHVASSWLTMGPTLCAGCVRWRDLGRGDVLGMRAVYP